MSHIINSSQFLEMTFAIAYSKFGFNYLLSMHVKLMSPFFFLSSFKDFSRSSVETMNAVLKVGLQLECQNTHKII